MSISSYYDAPDRLEMLFVNSGYGMFASAPGNVLLAFSVDGR